MKIFLKHVKKIKGLHIDKNNKRFYQYGEICSQLIGHTNYEDKGQSGIEFQSSFHCFFDKVIVVQLMLFS